MTDTTKVRNAADIPQQLDRRRRTGARPDLGLIGQRFQRHQIIGFARFDQKFVLWARFQRMDKRINGPEGQIGIPPVQLFDRGKAMVADGIDHIFGKRRCLARNPECPVAHTPARASRDLGQFIRRKGPHPATVKLGQR